MYKDEDIYYLYYDKEENIMIDEDGFVIHQINKLVHPNYMYLFFKNKEDMIVPGNNHPVTMGLVYPEEESLKGFFYNY